MLYFSYIKGSKFPSWKNKKPTLKKLLIFRADEPSSSKLKSAFFGKPLLFFITVFSGIFTSPLIFPTIFWVFLLLIAFAHFTNFLYPDWFFVTYFAFVLLYRECYRFERAVFLNKFLNNSSSNWIRIIYLTSE